MIGVYLSGTGNTKHCIEKLIYLLDETAQAVPIEGKETVRLLLLLKNNLEKRCRKW